jgi:hypothetical protein
MRFAEPLYEIHNACLPVLKKHGFVPHDCDKDGAFLQIIGTEYGRKMKGDNVWVDIVRRAVAAAIGTAEALGEKMFITIEDARFENEFDAFPDSLRIRLEASEGMRKERTHSWRNATNHASEIGLDKYDLARKFDLYFDSGALSVQRIVTDIMEAAWPARFVY